MEAGILNIIFKSYNSLPGFDEIKYLAILNIESGNTDILFSKQADGFEAVQPKLKELLKETDEENKILEGSYKEPEHNFYILQFNKNPFIYLMIQDDREISENQKKLCLFIMDNIQTSMKATETSGNERYKNQLAKLREFQARLFPKFNDVKNMDISSVYLPADLMSGNFIDAFPISDSVYQLVVCHVEGYDAASAFTSATIRTILRTNAPRMAPSGQLAFVMKKIDRIISGLHSLIYLTILQINTKNGDCRISSMGPPNILYISQANRKMIHMNDSQTGKMLSRRKDFMDISSHLAPGDTLIYFSNGVMKATSPTTDENYSLKNIVVALRECLDESSLYITHAISDSINEFTEYSHYEEDIILLAVKWQSQS